MAQAAAHARATLRRNLVGHRSAGLAHADLRNAPACRGGGPRPADRPDEPGHLFPAPHAGAVVLIAVLGRRGHAPFFLPAYGIRRIAALRPARSACEFWLMQTCC